MHSPQPITKKQVWHDQALFVRSGIDINVALQNAMRHHSLPTHTTKNTAPYFVYIAKIWSRFMHKTKNTTLRIFKPILLPMLNRFIIYFSRQIVAAMRFELQKNAEASSEDLKTMQKEILQELKQLRETIEANSPIQKEQAPLSPKKLSSS